MFGTSTLHLTYTEGIVTFGEKGNCVLIFFLFYFKSRFYEAGKSEKLHCCGQRMDLNGDSVDALGEKCATVQRVPFDCFHRPQRSSW